jgi:GntR family transcriptional regulator
MQVVGHIRTQILEGELRDGDRVPSARQIMQDWGIAMATATKVLAALKSEGLVRTLPGVGTVVTVSETAKAAQDRVRTMRRTGRVYPPNERAEIRSAEVVEAPEHVARALDGEAGQQVIRRHRVTLLDDTPVSASVSWFHGHLAEIAPMLLQRERITQGTFGYIEEVTGRAVAGGSDQLAADAATEQDALDLAVEVGTPVLRGRNWMTDSDGEVIEYGESVSVAGRWTSYQYEIS